MEKYSALTIKSFFATVAGVLILWVPVLLLHLTIVLFTGLITYTLIVAMATRFEPHFPNFHYARLFSLILLLLILVISLYILGDWLGDTASGYSLTALMTQSAAIIDQLHAKLPSNIAQHIPSSIESLQQSLTQTLKNHATQIQTAGIHTLRGMGYALAGVIIGAIAAFQIGGTDTLSSKPINRILLQQYLHLVTAFKNVFFAQVRIAAINTILTAIYLLIILPLLGKPLPMTGALVLLTFMASLLPVVGNLVSNLFIVILSLSQGLGIFVLSIIWLVGIHKLEYFLNAHIIGHKIKAAAWELLIAMLVMEAAFGLPGLVSAPIIYAQLKLALSQRGWV